MKKRHIVIFLFLLSNLTAVSQSKSETEGWIKEKIEKATSLNFYYNADKSDIYDGGPNVLACFFNYGGGVLNVEFDNNTMQVKNGDSYSRIPFNKVKSIDINYSSEARCKAIIVKMSDDNVIKNNVKLRCGAVEIFVDKNTDASSEHDLLQRLHKALSHYTELCGGRTREAF